MQILAVDECTRYALRILNYPCDLVSMPKQVQRHMFPKNGCTSVFDEKDSGHSTSLFSRKEFRIETTDNNPVSGFAIDEMVPLQSTLGDPPPTGVGLH